MMKTFNRDTFFRNTYCEFQALDIVQIAQLKLDYHSKSDSRYFYADDGVYRYADHWGRVANCRWKLVGAMHFKSQKAHLGFARWDQFFPMNDTDKLFYIQVDFEQGMVNFQHKDHPTYDQEYLFTAAIAQKRVSHIRTLLKSDNWAKYYTDDIDTLRVKIINEYRDSSRQLQEIKRSYK